MALYEINERQPVIGNGVWIAPTAQVIGDVRIGNNCYIGFGAILRGDYGTIILGDGTAIEEAVMIHARPGDKTVLGSRVTVGHMAMIHNASIEDNAVIGMNSTITDYSKIGEWAIIAEHSLVKTRQIIPAHKIYGGVPATEISDVKEKHIQIWSMAKQIYIDLTDQYNTTLKQIG